MVTMSLLNKGNGARVRATLAGFLLLLLPLSGECAESVAFKRLQGFIDKLRTLKADFTQEVDNGNPIDKPAETAGYFVASRPGKFLWHYRTPHEQKIVSDGHQVWYYEPDLRQATRTSSRSLEGTFARILTSGGRIDEQFHWKEVDHAVLNIPSIQLTPLQDEGAFRLIEITMDPKKEVIRELLLEDPLGNRSRIRFSSMHMNGKVDDAPFRFTPPKGVEIIDG